MKVAVIATILLFAVLPVPAALAQLTRAESDSTRDVTADRDQEVDFSHYKTFTFQDYTQTDPQNEAPVIDRIIRAVTDELSTKGLAGRVYADKYDLVIGFGGQIAPDPAHPELQRLSLWVVAVDAKTQKVVWRSRGGQDLVDDVNDNLGIGRALISAMVEHFPPAQE